MRDFNFRPTLRILQQVAKIERFSGKWDRLSRSTAIASVQKETDAISIGASCLLKLDVTTAPTEVRTAGGKSDLTLEQSRVDLAGKEASEPTSSLHRALSLAHTVELPFTALGIEMLHDIICDKDSKASSWAEPTATKDKADTSKYRKQSAQFLSSQNQRVFATIPAFLVEQRIEELVEWALTELDGDVYHPLIVIAVFHLLFLQIHPYETANHRLALTITWRLLDSASFPFVRYEHFASRFLENEDKYLGSLRQAEKSARGDWVTLNSWLDFFLDSLLATTEKLELNSNRREAKLRLTAVQMQIVNAVKDRGSATRDKIITDTGINLSTVKYNLSVLAAKGHLKRDGAGRTTSYSIL